MRIGITELLVILLIVMIILGPSQIPKLAHVLGKGVKEFRAGLNLEENKAPNGGAEENSGTA